MGVVLATGVDADDEPRLGAEVSTDEPTGVVGTAEDTGVDSAGVVVGAVVDAVVHGAGLVVTAAVNATTASPFRIFWSSSLNTA